MRPSLRRTTPVALALLACGALLALPAGPAGGAARASTGSSSPGSAATGSTSPGPAGRDVLALDPATVRPPDLATGTLAAAAATCPAADGNPHFTAPGSGRTVALTFDDGPGATTDQLLDILQRAGITATFFNIGINQAAAPAQVREEAALGHQTGNHTWSHPVLTGLSSTGQATEIDRATAEQVAILGSAPCAFRPPYGSYNGTTLSLATARRMSLWTWSLDTEDWKSEGSASSFWVNRIITRGTSSTQQHPVVLMHNPPRALPATVLALPTIIKFYADRGYTFVDLLGHPADRPVTGDWDGNGTSTPGLARGALWTLRNSTTSGPADLRLGYGLPNDRPVSGDWDGDGVTTPGMVRGNVWYLRATNAATSAATAIPFGSAGDLPVTGDWDGNGTSTPGVYRGSTWYLRGTNAATSAVTSFAFGSATDLPVTGDWNADGTTDVGIFRHGTWALRVPHSAGPATTTFAFGTRGDRPVTGDWDGNGSVTIGVVRGSTWYLRNSTSAGPADVVLTFAP